MTDGVRSYDTEQVGAVEYGSDRCVRRNDRVECFFECGISGESCLERFGSGSPRTFRRDIGDPDPAINSRPVSYGDPVCLRCEGGCGHLCQGRRPCHDRSGFEFEIRDRNQGKSFDATVGSEQIGDEGIRRVAQYFAWWAVLLEMAALAQDSDTVPQLDGLVDIVGDESDGLAETLLKSEEFILEVGRVTGFGGYSGVLMLAILVPTGALLLSFWARRRAVPRRG